MPHSAKSTPPRIAEMLLLKFLRHDLAEEVLGDLEEKFYVVAERKSLVRARLNYWYQVLNYLRPFALGKFWSNSNTTVMFRHNLLLSFRNFKKYKSQFFINLTGLSTGLTCVLFIYLWVTDERQVDKFHANDARLYQVMSNHSDASGISTWKGVPGLLFDEVKATVPEVENSVVMTDAHEYTISAGDTYFKANGKFASEEFFNVFSYPLLEGDGKASLLDQSGIVITASLAERLFKSTEVIGKQLVWHFWGNTKTLQISGVMEDLPPGASEKFDFVMSWNYYHDDLVTYKNWFNYYARLMVVLGTGADKEKAASKIDAILKEQQNDDGVDLFLAKFSDRYLYGKYENGVVAGGRIEYVRLFTIVALFILFIACINFINLSTAKATHRIKEIGVKKSLGASRASLMGQYFTETVLLSIISLAVALLIVGLLLPQFNLIAQKQLSLSLNSEMTLAAAALVVTVGMLAGSYPALYLSGLKSVEVLKGRLSRKTAEVWGRKVLVVVQFTLSIILILCVTVVYQQMDYVKNKNLGYDKENLLYFEREGRLIDHYEAFVNELKAVPGVADAVVSGYMVGGGNSTGGVGWEGKTPEKQVQFWEIRSGYGLVEIMGMELLQGRTFSNEFGSDSSSVIFNETAIKAMGMENPIGKTISHYSGDKKIVGVVKDFNLHSLHSGVEPMIFLYEPASTHFVMAKLEKGREVQAIREMENLYQSFNPGYVFKPQFIDQDYQAMYASEDRVGTLAGYFAGFAILISCLGLFGQAAFTAERKTKELGIRKILGSGVFGIIYMLSAEFTKMVLAAIAIALPLGYFIASRWLADFAFRIDLAWWIFAISGMGALLIAWLTVGIQTFKAARINPADCLRNE